MKKLFWKVYIPLAVCVVLTLVLSVFAITKIIPAQLNEYRRNMEDFHDFLLSSHYHDKDIIMTVADSLGLNVRVVENVGHLQRIPPPEGYYRLPGLPFDYPWRVDISGGPRSGPAGYLRLSFWFILLALLLMEGLVLFLALWPVRKRLARLKWIASEFGSGNLGVRLQVRRKGDLIDAVGKTFNGMAARIESLVESHQELLGIVAHELRTPMTRMTLALELLKEEADGSDLSKIVMMEKDLISLDRLVTELLAFNKLRRVDKIVREDVDLREICDELVQAESWRRNDLNIQIEGQALFSGDRTLLGRAVGNLIRNAAKYAASKIRISIRKQSEGETLIVSVEDDGDGYDPEITERLGEPFLKGHSSDGTGLGLAIASRIAGLHGGKLYFGSSETLGGAMAVLKLGIR